MYYYFCISVNLNLTFTIAFVAGEKSVILKKKRDYVSDVIGFILIFWLGFRLKCFIIYRYFWLNFLFVLGFICCFKNFYIEKYVIRLFVVRHFGFRHLICSRILQLRFLREKRVWYLICLMSIYSFLYIYFGNFDFWIGLDFIFVFKYVLLG